MLPSSLGYLYLGSQGGPCSRVGERQTSYHIARQGMPLQLPSLSTAKEGNVPLSLKPRLGLSFHSYCGLPCSSKNSVISIFCCHMPLLFSAASIKVKRKSKYYLLQKSLGSTALVRHKRPALPGEEQHLSQKKGLTMDCNFSQRQI